MSQRIAYEVHGKVQGVFFRKFAQQTADSLGVTGSVSNSSSGTVSGEVQGDSNAVASFVKEIGKGPSHANVTKVEKKDIDTKSGETTFDIV